MLPSRLTLREIADELFISVNTLKFHLQLVYRKLGVASRAEAPRWREAWRARPRRPARWWRDADGPRRTQAGTAVRCDLTHCRVVPHHPRRGHDGRVRPTRACPSAIRWLTSGRRVSDVAKTGQPRPRRVPRRSSTGPSLPEDRDPALATWSRPAAIRILDLVCVSKSAEDGEPTVVEFEEAEGMAALEAVDGDIGVCSAPMTSRPRPGQLAAGSSAILLSSRTGGRKRCHRQRDGPEDGSSEVAVSLVRSWRRHSSDLPSDGGDSEAGGR
jgi:hypothetical protein